MMRILRENIRQRLRLPSSELEEIYPTASGKAKEDEEYRERALHATYLAPERT